MQTLSDLAKSIQQKTSEQARNTEQIVSSELGQLEQSLQQRLSESERSISNAITSHEKNLKEQINKTLAYKTAIGGIMGLLLAIILGLGIFNLYLAKNITKKQAELAEIQQNIDQSPIQAKALAKVTVMEWKSEKGSSDYTQEQKSNLEQRQQRQSITIHQIGLLDHAKRLHERLQQFAQRVRATVSPVVATNNNQSQQIEQLTAVNRNLTAQNERLNNENEKLANINRQQNDLLIKLLGKSKMR